MITFRRSSSGVCREGLPLGEVPAFCRRVRREPLLAALARGTYAFLTFLLRQSRYRQNVMQKTDQTATVSSPKTHTQQARELLAMLLSAEEDEFSLLSHLRLVRDPKGLEQLRKVRQKIAALSEQLAKELRA